ncbi:MAG: hypothetical protein AB2L18_06335 [Anaerolineaceae bacterium]
MTVQTGYRIFNFIGGFGNPPYCSLRPGHGLLSELTDSSLALRMTVQKVIGYSILVADWETHHTALCDQVMGYYRG